MKFTAAIKAALLFKKSNFIVIIGAGKDDAQMQMSNIRAALEDNERILEDFPLQHTKGRSRR